MGYDQGAEQGASLREGTGASASALMDSTSSSGCALSPTCLPMGGRRRGHRCTALFTNYGEHLRLATRASR